MPPGESRQSVPAGEGRGVSVVFGTILLTMITVVSVSSMLLAMSGVFPGLEGMSPPQAKFEFEGSPGYQYTIVHQFGDEFQAKNVDVVVNPPEGHSKRISWAKTTEREIIDVGQQFEFGDVGLKPPPRSVIQVVWENDVTGTGSILAELVVPAD